MKLYFVAQGKADIEYFQIALHKIVTEEKQLLKTKLWLHPDSKLPPTIYSLCCLPIYFSQSSSAFDLHDVCVYRVCLTCKQRLPEGLEPIHMQILIYIGMCTAATCQWTSCLLGKARSSNFVSARTFWRRKRFITSINYLVMETNRKSKNRHSNTFDMANILAWNSLLPLTQQSHDWFAATW